METLFGVLFLAGIFAIGWAFGKAAARKAVAAQEVVDDVA